MKDPNACAVGGLFPWLPSTPKPLGIDLLLPDTRRCPGCDKIKKLFEFKYNADEHNNSAARCAECRYGSKKRTKPELMSLDKIEKLK